MSLFAQNPLIAPHLIQSKSWRFHNGPQGPTWSVCLSFRSHLLFQTHWPPCWSSNMSGMLPCHGFCRYCSLCPEHSSFKWPHDSLPDIPAQCPVQNRNSINIYCWCWIFQSNNPIHRSPVSRTGKGSATSCRCITWSTSEGLLTLIPVPLSWIWINFRPPSFTTTWILVDFASKLSNQTEKKYQTVTTLVHKF